MSDDPTAHRNSSTGECDVTYTEIDGYCHKIYYLFGRPYYIARDTEGVNPVYKAYNQSDQEFIVTKSNGTTATYDPTNSEARLNECTAVEEKFVIFGRTYINRGTTTNPVYELQAHCLGDYQQLGGDIYGWYEHNYHATTVAISGDGNTIAVGAEYNDFYLDETTNVWVTKHNSGIVKLFKRNSSYTGNTSSPYYPPGWEPLDGILDGRTIVGENESDAFGSSIALSNDGYFVAVGAKGMLVNEDTAFGGYVKVFKKYHWSSSSMVGWDQVGQTIYADNAEDGFGICVALSSDGNILAASASSRFGSSSGYVKVYEKNLDTQTWVQIGQNIQPSESDYFGESMAMSSDGNVIVAGVPDHPVGEVYVYERDSNSTIGWTQVGETIVGGSRLGRSISINSDGTIFAVGTSSSSDGNIKVYQRDSSVTQGWTQIGSDIRPPCRSINCSNTSADEDLGYSVDINANGDKLILGARENDDNGIHSGRAVVFEWDGADWIEMIDDIQGINANDTMGWAVAISDDGNTFIVGAPTLDDEDTPLEDQDNYHLAGYARVFEYTGPKFRPYYQQL